MHTRHTFGVADDELRGYMVTSPFVVPHFLVRQIADDVCQRLLVRSVSRPIVVYPTLCLQLQFEMPRSFQLDPDVLQPQFWGFPNDRPSLFQSEFVQLLEKQTSVTCCPSPVEPTLMRVYSFIAPVSIEAEFIILLQHSCTLFATKLSLS